MSQPGSREPQLSAIAEKVAAHDGWNFSIFYGGDFAAEEPSFGPVDQVQIKRQIDEFQSLLDSGHYRAAFILGWALLEALARTLDPDSRKPSQGAFRPNQITEFLEQNGFVDEEVGRRLSSLVSLRNAAVHGDFRVEVDKGAVEFLYQILGGLFARASETSH